MQTTSASQLWIPSYARDVKNYYVEKINYYQQYYRTAAEKYEEKLRQNERSCEIQNYYRFDCAIKFAMKHVKQSYKEGAKSNCKYVAALS